LTRHKKKTEVATWSPLGAGGMCVTISDAHLAYLSLSKLYFK
jgi:hypothetical protein